MFGSLSKKAWLVIGAVVAAVAATMVVVALAVSGSDDAADDADVATGAGTSEPDRATDATSTPSSDGTESTSGTATAPSTECDDPVAPGDVLGRRDLDGDGVDELFVAAGAGAATDIIAVFRVEGCEAVQVTAGGAPAEFAVGATVRNVSGLHASDDGVTVYSGTSTDAEAFDVTWRTLHYEGGVLTETASETGTAQVGDELHILASTFSP